MLLSEPDAVKYLHHKNNYPYSDSMITQQYSETFPMERKFILHTVHFTLIDFYVKLIISILPWYVTIHLWQPL